MPALACASIARDGFVCCVAGSEAIRIRMLESRRGWFVTRRCTFSLLCNRLHLSFNRRQHALADNLMETT
jgi:hypothetical protein